MPALVKANSSMLAGGVVLASYNVSRNNSLTLTVNAEFICLKSATVDNLFRIGSQPPAALLSLPEFALVLASNKALGVPVLADVQSVINAGLRTISAQYIASIEPTNDTPITDDEGNTSNITPGNGLAEISISQELRSLSGSVVYRTYVNNELFETSFAFSQDYLTESVIVSSNNGAVLNAAVPNPQLTLLSARGAVSLAQVETTIQTLKRTSSNSRGESRVETTSVAVLVQTVFDILA